MDHLDFDRLKSSGGQMFVQYHLNRSRSNSHQHQHLHHQTSSGSAGKRVSGNQSRADLDALGKQHAPRSPAPTSSSVDRQPASHRRLDPRSLQLTFDFSELSLGNQSASRESAPASRKSTVAADETHSRWPSLVTSWSARARILVELPGKFNCFEPKRKIQLMTEFCLNFLAYQLETLFLLAESAQMAVRLASEPKQGRCRPAGAERVGLDNGEREVVPPAELQARRLNKDARPCSSCTSSSE